MGKMGAYRIPVFSLASHSYGGRGWKERTVSLVIGALVRQVLFHMYIESSQSFHVTSVVLVLLLRDRLHMNND